MTRLVNGFASPKNSVVPHGQLAESDGIVFIDEIDKIVTSHDSRHGADASSEGVQRDLLPIIEGRLVNLLSILSTEIQFNLSN